jgi:predicted ester cyclase
MGIPPTQNSVEVSGIAVDRFSDGKIVESWGNWDTLGLMQQLGAIPAPAQSA